MAAKLTLLARKNIKENEEKTKEALEEIKEFLELPCDVTLDAAFPELEAWGVKNSRANQCGSVAFSYVEAFLGTLKYQFKEETAKQALQTTWTTGVIKLETAEKKKTDPYGYCKTEIRDGDLVITIWDYCNVSDCGRDLLAKLGDSSRFVTVFPPLFLN